MEDLIIVFLLVAVVGGAIFINWWLLARAPRKLPANAEWLSIATALPADLALDVASGLTRYPPSFTDRERGMMVLAASVFDRPPDFAMLRKYYGSWIFVTVAVPPGQTHATISLAGTAKWGDFASHLHDAARWHRDNVAKLLTEKLQSAGSLAT